MRRADRLFQIVQFLRGRRLTTARWLAEKLEVSDRTIYRDIQDLMASGVPIDGEAGMGYVLHKTYDMPPLMFDQEEIEAVTIGLRMVRSWGGHRLERAAIRAQAKINGALPLDLRRRFGRVSLYSPGWTKPFSGEFFDLIHAAIGNTQVLHMDYCRIDSTQSEQRHIWPLGLFFWGAKWTLVAWCEKRTDFRTFRLDRITALQAAGRNFTPQRDRDLDAYFKSVGVPADLDD
ncbi:putative DNA-binding transcriptional regulator YafY [Silvimonas terrae]|uniref:Putative DNA-binding transcriptional regulator YafY n=1 Tax=Silvimonas terrae TaxID=300266 RepID=A0A840RGW0_9NEIS|nr:YafY family protein [Silvimonas terrae]MBB5192565.1 putative DNA-binding transcriptional regulator YafY [Silvimonas terrae]